MARLSSTMPIIIKVLKNPHVTLCLNVHVDQIIIKIIYFAELYGGKLEEK